jgi:hypothetical protein
MKGKNFRVYFDYKEQEKYIDFSVFDGTITKETIHISANTQISKHYPLNECSNIRVEELNVW